MSKSKSSKENEYYGKNDVSRTRNNNAHNIRCPLRSRNVHVSLDNDFRICAHVN